MLLARDDFRKLVFERDRHRCVVCGNGLYNGHKIDAHQDHEHVVFSKLDGRTTSDICKIGR